MIRHALTVLYVPDQRAAAAFYASVLGLAPTLDVPGMTEFRLSDGATLGLMPEAGIARLLHGAVQPGAHPGAVRAELYLIVDDPAEHHRRALAAGARELSPLLPRAWGDLAAYSLAPEGTVLAFAARG